jgi:hypothetical protein
VREASYSLLHFEGREKMVAASRIEPLTTRKEMYTLRAPLRVDLMENHPANRRLN